MENGRTFLLHVPWQVERAALMKRSWSDTAFEEGEARVFNPAKVGFLLARLAMTAFWSSPTLMVVLTFSTWIWKAFHLSFAWSIWKLRVVLSGLSESSCPFCNAPVEAWQTPRQGGFVALRHRSAERWLTRFSEVPSTLLERATTCYQARIIWALACMCIRRQWRHLGTWVHSSTTPDCSNSMPAATFVAQELW